MKNPFSLQSEMRIRERVFFLLLFVFVPILFLQGITFYKWYRESKEAEMQANLELSRTVSKTFDHFIKNILHTQLFIGLTAISSPPPSNDSLRRILHAAEETNPMLRAYAWISPAGVNLVATNQARENRTIRARAVVSRVISGEEYGVSDVYDSPQTGEKVFEIGRGIRNSEGNLLGVVSCICYADKLDSLLAVQRSDNAGISLTDSKGTSVYRYPVFRELTPEQANWIKRFPMIQHALEEKETIGNITGPKGEIRLAAFVPVPSIGWVAGSSRPEHEVIESIIQALLPHAMFMLLVTLAAFGAAVILSHPISISIRRLQYHADALGRGEVVTLEKPLGPREVKQLAETFNDMAEKVRSREQSLRESEQKFRALFENSQEAVFLTSPDGSIAAANPAACTMLGRSEEEICRLGRSGVLDPGDPRLSAALEERKRTGRVQARELTAIRKSGERFPVEVDSVILPFEPVWSFVIMRDITERKRLEEELRKSRDDLELRVEARTAELQRKNQELQEFAFIASHDLKEPLRKIKIFGSLLEERSADLNEQSRGYVSRMAEGASRMEELLEALRRYSWLDTGREEFGPVKLDEIVRDVAMDLDLTIQEIGAHLEICRLPTVNGDPYQLRLLFHNLIANALKYHRPEDRTLIEIYGEENEGNTCIFVKDNGIGFDEKYVNKIFQPFQRLHGKHEYSGTGIGLTICRKIVERHGGMITARSVPGKGSTFVVTLPLAEQKPE